MYTIELTHRFVDDEALWCLEADVRSTLEDAGFRIFDASAWSDALNDDGYPANEMLGINWDPRENGG